MNDEEFKRIMNQMLGTFTSEQKDFILVGFLTLVQKALDYLGKLGLGNEFLEDYCRDPEMEKVLKMRYSRKQRIEG